MPTVPPPGDFYLVASFKSFAPIIPPVGAGAFGPVPAAIQTANILCVIQAASEEAAVKLLRDWDQQPPGTQYFAVRLEHVSPTTQQLPYVPEP